MLSWILLIRSFSLSLSTCYLIVQSKKKKPAMNSADILEAKCTLPSQSCIMLLVITLPAFMQFDLSKKNQISLSIDDILKKILLRRKSDGTCRCHQFTSEWKKRGYITSWFTRIIVVILVISMRQMIDSLRQRKEIL